MDEAVIARSVPCSRCGYDLRGLRVGGSCPECGLDLWDSVHDVVDPAARALPQLRNPRGVGDALVWLAFCLLSATVLGLARPLALTLGELFPARAMQFDAMALPGLLLIAGLALLAGLWSAWRLAPPRSADVGGGVRHKIALLAWSLGLGAAVCFIAWALHGRILVRSPLPRGPQMLPSALHMAGMAALAMTMRSLRDVLRVIGERSREYRTAQGGRQRMRDMIAAALVVCGGLITRLVGEVIRREVVVEVGTIIVWISTFMLLVGLVYLLVNAWWIRRSLRRPPPTLRELLRRKGRPLPPSGEWFVDEAETIRPASDELPGQEAEQKNLDPGDTPEGGLPRPGF